jgi:hypothetical protein
MVVKKKSAASWQRTTMVIIHQWLNTGKKKLHSL